MHEPLHVIYQRIYERKKNNKSFSQSRSVWKCIKWKLNLHWASVGVKLLSKCVFDACKALFLELAVNHRHTSRKVHQPTNSPMHQLTSSFLQNSSNTLFPKSVASHQVTSSPQKVQNHKILLSIKTKILASGFCRPSY